MQKGKEFSFDSLEIWPQLQELGFKIHSNPDKTFCEVFRPQMFRYDGTAMETRLPMAIIRLPRMGVFRLFIHEVMLNVYECSIEEVNTILEKVVHQKNHWENWQPKTD